MTAEKYVSQNGRWGVVVHVPKEIEERIQTINGIRIVDSVDASIAEGSFSTVTLTEGDGMAIWGEAELVYASTPKLEVGKGLQGGKAVSFALFGADETVNIKLLPYSGTPLYYRLTAGTLRGVDPADDDYNDVRASFVLARAKGGKVIVKKYAEATWIASQIARGEIEALVSSHMTSDVQRTLAYIHGLTGQYPRIAHALDEAVIDLQELFLQVNNGEKIDSRVYRGYATSKAMALIRSHASDGTIPDHLQSVRASARELRARALAETGDNSDSNNGDAVTVVNVSTHPQSAAAVAALESLVGGKVSIHDIPVHIDMDGDIPDHVNDLVEKIKAANPDYIIAPGLGWLAFALGQALPPVKVVVVSRNSDGKFLPTHILGG